jgi:hypothetical protein
MRLRKLNRVVMIAVSSTLAGMAVSMSGCKHQAPPRAMHPAAMPPTVMPAATLPATTEATATTEPGTAPSTMPATQAATAPATTAPATEAVTPPVVVVPTTAPTTVPLTEPAVVTHWSCARPGGGRGGPPRRCTDDRSGDRDDIAHDRAHNGTHDRAIGSAGCGASTDQRCAGADRSG